MRQFFQLTGDAGRGYISAVKDDVLLTVGFNPITKKIGTVPKRDRKRIGISRG